MQLCILQYGMRVGMGNQVQQHFFFGVGKDKAIPVTGYGGPGCCEALRVSYLLDSRLTDGGKVVSLTCQPHFTPPGRFLVLISVRG
jgi:hypothetical protein